MYFQFSTVPTANIYVQTDPIEEPVIPANSDKSETQSETKEPETKESETKESETKESDEDMDVLEKKEPVSDKKEVKMEPSPEMLKLAEEKMKADWEATYAKMLVEQEEKTENKYKAKQQKALNELSERVSIVQDRPKLK